MALKDVKVDDTCVEFGAGMTVTQFGQALQNIKPQLSGTINTLLVLCLKRHMILLFHNISGHIDF